MKSVQGSHVTVNEICEYFKNQGISVGTTTVYRHLEKMVREGVVAKYVVDGTSSACFEYTGEKKQDSQPVCYHCKCEKCGKLIHLQCEEVESLKQHMMEHHNFEKEENHNCTGEDCPVCACIHQAEQNLKNLGTGFAVAAMPGQKILPVLVAAFLVSCVVERFMGR